MKQSGWRKPTPDMCAIEQSAHPGDREPVSKAQAFTTAKKIAAHLGLKAGEMVLLDLLAAFTKEQDWEDGNVPLVWPSNNLLMEQTGFSRSALKRHLRRLGELGLIRFHDSPNGKRWGKRDAYGDIVEAYGFDLSPLAHRAHEFERLHQQVVAERQKSRKLRREITALRRDIAELISAIDHDDPQSSPAFLERLDRILLGGAAASHSQELLDQRGMLRDLLGDLQETALSAAELKDAATSDTRHEVAAAGPSNRDPMGSSNEPHIQLTDKPNIQHRSTQQAGTLNEKPAQNRHQHLISKKQADLGSAQVNLVDARTILLACPEFAAWHKTSPGGTDWACLFRTATELAPMIALSSSTVTRATEEIGPSRTATAIALLTEKVARGTVKQPDAYLAGMLRKARNGDLHLSKSVRGYLAKRNQMNADAMLILSP